MAANEVLSDILNNIQDSNLNFNLNLTPYSAYITIRKSFVKNIAAPALKTSPTGPVISVSEGSLQERCKLIEKNNQLLEQVDALTAANHKSEDTIKVLEEKISKVEEAALRAFEEKKQEIVILKNSIKKQESDIIVVKKELDLSKKALKEKEKEIYRMDQKIENLLDKITRLKTETNSLKAENKKLSKKKSPKITETSTLKNTSSSKVSCSSSSLVSAFTSDCQTLLAQRTASPVSDQRSPFELDPPSSPPRACTTVLTTPGTPPASPAGSDQRSSVELDPPSSSPRASATVLTTPGIPPAPSLENLAWSFQNFRNTFKDEDNNLKYSNLVKEWQENQTNTLFVSILDIDKYNQILQTNSELTTGMCNLSSKSRQKYLQKKYLESL